MNEFDFIKTYLANAPKDKAVLLGIGDDAAVVRPNLGRDLCVSSDMLLSGRHFFADTAPQDVAHKVLAVNLSDMAAMGARPRWVLLSAALPELDATWLRLFCDSFFALCAEYGVSLIGGDTTKGHSVFNVMIIGDVPQGLGLRRSGARVGDDVWVSGHIGSAAAALQHMLGKAVLPEPAAEHCRRALLRPVPRVALGQALLTLANAAQDISDGLIQDLTHILDASDVGAEIEENGLPVLPALRECLPEAVRRQCMLAGGDDYELLFTASSARRAEVEQAARQCQTEVCRIGRITAQHGLRVRDAAGRPIHLARGGYDHFA